MEGRGSATLEARTTLIVLDAWGASQAIQSVIDTGFNGFLTLDGSLIAKLKLPWLYRHNGELADGTVQVFDVFEAAVIWDGRQRIIEVESVDAEPLLGMALMAGHELRIEVRPDGIATITQMPA